MSQTRLIWLGAATLAVTALIMFLPGKLMNAKSIKPRNIRAILAGKVTFPLAPENISTIPLYHVHTNLWGTVLSPHGEPGLAKLIDTADSGKTFRFEILPDMRFSNGRAITSEDILFSIQRLMGNQPGGHFSAKLIIEKMLATSDRHFEIILKEPTLAFLFLLSLPEMGIVPREACDSHGVVISHAVTSGPYVMDSPATADEIILKKNPYYRAHHSQSPDQVTVLFRRGMTELFQSIQSSEIDFIEFRSLSTESDFQKIRSLSGMNFIATLPSLSTFLVTNPKQMSLDQRVSFAHLIYEKLKYPFISEIGETFI